MRLSLSLLADDAEAADAHAEAMRTMREGMATPAMEWNEFGVLYATASWRPGAAEPVARGMFEFFRADPDDFGRTPLLHVLALAGLEDELRAELARAPLTPMRRQLVRHREASVRALVAGSVGDVALARRSVEILRPLSGRMAVSGISLVVGPGRRLPRDRPGRASASARRRPCVRRRGPRRCATPLGDDGLPAAGSAERLAPTHRLSGRVADLRPWSRAAHERTPPSP